jgi:hypothetical protein
MTRGRSLADVNTGFMAMNHQAVRVLNRTHLYRFSELQIFFIIGRPSLRMAAVAVQQWLRHHGTTTLYLTQALRLL